MFRDICGGMSQNPPLPNLGLRPDLAPKLTLRDTPRPGQPTIGMVSLGCPKALVDSERILTRLRAEGYAIDTRMLLLLYTLALYLAQHCCEQLVLPSQLIKRPSLL